MGYLRYGSVTSFIQLSENKRVSSTDQPSFRDFLIRFRNGDKALEDWALLCGCNVSKFIMPSTTPVRLAYTNSVVAENNYSISMSLNKSMYTNKIVRKSFKAAKLITDEFGGLQSVLQLSVVARVILLLNL